MTDYYVKNTGDDAKDGLSDANAWQTISKVSGSTFSGGDNIYFNKGDTWREELTVNQSGSANSYITYDAYGTGNDPIITGGDVVTTWTVDAGNVYVAALTYAGTLYLLLEDGVPLLPVANKAAINAAGKFWFDDGNDLVYCWATDGTDPDTHTMEAGVRSNGINAQNRTYIKIKNLYLQGSGNQFGGGIKAGSNSAAGGNIEIRDCEISGCYYSGIWGLTDAGQTALDVFEIYDTEVHDCAAYGIRTTGENAGNPATNVLISGCNVHDNGVDTSAVGEHAVHVFNCDGAIVDGCTVQDNQGRQNWGGGLYVDTSPNCDVRYSEFINNNPHNVNFDVAPNGFTFKYNISRDSPGVGLVIEEHVTADGSSVVYNNVFENNDIGLRHGPGGTVFEVTSVAHKNNLFYDNISHNVSVEGSSIDATNTFDYNFYYYTGAQKGFNIVGDDWKTLAEWITASPSGNWEPNSTGEATDPLFTNVGGNDFTLQLTSPAINAGVDVDLTRDYAGSYVPIGSVPDMGAYESKVTDETAVSTIAGGLGGTVV